MSEPRVPPGRMQTGSRGGTAKRKRGRPPRVAVDSASTPVIAKAAQDISSPNSSTSESNKNLTELEERVNDLSESWETESLFEDLLDDLTEENNQLALGSPIDPESCTPEEAMRYRQELRAIGPEEFCRRTVDAGVISAKRLLTAFGVRPPNFLEGEPDESYFGLLSLALSRELSKRAKLLRYNSVDDAVHLLQTRKNIIVLTGAGISTSLGIPDFRSKDIGLYSRLAHLGLSDPQEVFDINVFKDDPSIFYSVARDILPSTDRFTPTHAFIAMLQQKGKLLTNYSQNIDNLEAKAGIEPSKLIQCHGSFATASCVVCGYRVEGETIYPTIKAGRIPRCPQCAAKPRGGSTAAAAAIANRKQRKISIREAVGNTSGGSLSRSSSFDNTTNMGGISTSASTPAPAPIASRGRGRPRGRPPGKVGRPRGRPRKQNKRSDDSSDGAEDDDNDFRSGRGGGVMKPDITFFGEPLPDEFSRRLTEHDRDKADLVVVIGTSLKVAPVSEVVPFMPPNIPQIYISRTPVNHINFDIDLLGDCDVVVSELCRRAGWGLKHEMVPENQQIHIETSMGGFPSRHMFTDVTPGKVEDINNTAAGVPAKVEVKAPKELQATDMTEDPADIMTDVGPNVEINAKTDSKARGTTFADDDTLTDDKPNAIPDIMTAIKTDVVTEIREIPFALPTNELGRKLDETV